MSNAILIIAHSPLASALRACAMHVLPDAGAAISALDVLPDDAAQDTLAAARLRLSQSACSSTLLLVDILGASPCNVAQQLVDGVTTRLVTGVNLPMLLRALTYRHESLEALVARALSGGAQGVLQVLPKTLQNEENPR